ncbi:hypothetical protein [Marinicellulosiphila megalodicopiae]|uniref:hypothetical protein n=1 Tax=Marinicellulosiphila megalodicopiae TaxID=2724896 RepID=UPI003BAFA68A
MKNLIKSKGRLLVFSAGLVFTNFFTTIIIASVLGFGLDLDIYYMTLSVYLFLLSSVGWSLTNVITPMLIRNGIEKTISSVFYIVFSWALLVVGGVILLFPFIINILYGNYSEVFSMKYIYLLVLISCIIFIIDILAQVFICFENASSRFGRAILINFISSLAGLIVCFCFVKNMGVVGALLTQATIKLTLLIILLYFNFKFLTKINYNKKLAKELFERSKYFFVSGVYYRTEDIVEKYIASFLAPGFLSLVTFVQRIYGALITVINTVFVTPTLTRFCKSNTVSEKYSDHKFVKLLSVIICLVSLLLFPIIYLYGDVFLFLIFSEKLLGVVDSVTLTLVLIFPTLTLLTINQLLHNFLLSRSKEKNIAVNDMISYTISLVVKIVLTIKFGFIGFLIGIVLSASIKLFFKAIVVFGVVKTEQTI